MNKPLLVLFAFAILLAASCKKNKTTSAHDEMVGTWVIIGEGNDDNGNGVLDANETHADIEHTYYIFNADGTGKIRDVLDSSLHTEDDSSYRWTLMNNDTYLRITGTYGIPVDYDTILVHLDVLNNTNMTWKSSRDSTKPYLLLVKHP